MSFYLFIKDKYAFSAIAYGLALASKWSALWALPIFPIAFLLLGKKFRLNYIWFILLPPLVYLASYIPMFTSGHGFDIFIGVQKQMWWYHTRLEAEHPFTSPWWSWPILLRPIWVYAGGVVDNVVSNIYIMGNPIVFWGGLIAVLVCVYLVIKNFSLKNEWAKKIALIVFSYAIFFVPWAASPRIMFLYHYLPSIPFLAILLGFILAKYKKVRLWFFSLAMVAFIYFLPRYTGITVPVWLDESYHWFKTW